MAGYKALGRGRRMVVLQKDGFQVGGAVQVEDGVGRVPPLHERGHGLPQVQVTQVTRGHAVWRGHTCVYLYLNTI